MQGRYWSWSAVRVLANVLLVSVHMKLGRARVCCCTCLSGGDHLEGSTDEQSWCWSVSVYLQLFKWGIQLTLTGWRERTEVRGVELWGLVFFFLEAGAFSAPRRAPVPHLPLCWPSRKFCFQCASSLLTTLIGYPHKRASWGSSFNTIKRHKIPSSLNASWCSSFPALCEGEDRLEDTGLSQRLSLPPGNQMRG